MSRRTESLDTSAELIDFMARRGQRPDENYLGKFHHLNFDWTAYQERAALTMAVIEVLEPIDWEERRDFTAQMIWRVLTGGDALERLLSVAFGQQGRANCR
ncbi:hypothetical protein D3C86_1044460 [compost metagenome]